MVRFPAVDVRSFFLNCIVMAGSHLFICDEVELIEDSVVFREIFFLEELLLLAEDGAVNLFFFGLLNGLTGGAPFLEKNDKLGHNSIWMTLESGVSSANNAGSQRDENNNDITGTK